MRGLRFWRPDWTWRLRRLTCGLLIAWFVSVIPLCLIAAILYGETAVAVVFGCWIAVLVLFAAGMRLLDVRLRRRWRRVAEQRGWTVRASDPDLARRWPFPPFSGHSGTEVLHVTEGSHRGRRFRTGLFRYRIGQQWFGFCFIDLEIDRPLPPMLVSTELLVNRVAPGLLPMDLHLESGVFNDRFRILRGDRDTVHSVLNPRAMEAMLSVQPFGWVSHGERFVLLAPDYRRPETILGQLDAGCDLIELIPAHVWSRAD